MSQIALEAPVIAVEAAPVAAPARVSSRAVSLDVLRGLTVCLMLVVNNTVGNPNPQLTHAEWGGGLNLADLVFPWFLFCSGAALPFGKTHSLKRILTRAAWLFTLGCLLVSTVEQSPIFSLGVLQLIALAGLCAAALQPLPWKARIGIAAGLLVGYWALVLLTPIPNVGMGVFDEDKNAIRHLNSFLEPLGLRGLPSVIPTTALMMIGALITQLLRASSDLRARFVNLLLAGLSLTALGLLWNLSLEFNKPTWTPSYVVYSAGLATLLLAVFQWLEPQRWFRWLSAPLVIFGSNALLAYVVPILVKVNILQAWQLGGVTLQQAAINGLRGFSPQWGAPLYTTLYVLIWWGVAWFAYRKGWFFKV